MSRPPTTLCNSSTLAEELALGPAVAGFIVIPFHLFVFFTSSSSESLRGGRQLMNEEQTGITILLKPDKKQAPVRGGVKVFPGGWLIEVSPGVRCRARQ